MTEKSPFAWEVMPQERWKALLKRAYSEEGQYYHKNNNLVHQLLSIVLFLEYNGIPERYHMPAIALIIIVLQGGICKVFVKEISGVVTAHL